MHQAEMIFSWNAIPIIWVMMLHVWFSRPPHGCAANDHKAASLARLWVWVGKTPLPPGDEQLTEYSRSTTNKTPKQHAVLYALRLRLPDLWNDSFRPTRFLERPTPYIYKWANWGTDREGFFVSMCPASQGLSLWVSEPPTQCPVATPPCFTTLWGGFFLGKRYLSPSSPPKSYPALRPAHELFHGHSSHTVLCLVTQSCPSLCNPMDWIAHQAPLSMGILQARMF